MTPAERAERYEKNLALAERAKDDDNLEILSSGAIYDRTARRFVGHDPGSPTLWDAAKAREMAAKRKLNIQNAILDGLRNAVLEKGIELFQGGDELYLEAVRQMTEAQFKLATSPEAGRASTEAAKWLVKEAKDIGLSSPEQEGSIVAGTLEATLRMSGEDAARFLQVIDQRRQENARRENPAEWVGQEDTSTGA